MTTYLLKIIAIQQKQDSLKSTKVLKANTDRMRNSSIIYMQNLLNTEHKRKLEESKLN